MRIIRFRGKDILTGEWRYGSHYGDNGEEYIIPTSLGSATDYENYQVDPATVGQFIGLQDTNGNDIYEGDVLESIPKDEYITRMKQDREAYRRLLEERGVSYPVDRVSVEESMNFDMEWSFHEKAVVEYVDFSFFFIEVTDNKLRRNFAPTRPEYWRIIGNIYDQEVNNIQVSQGPRNLQNL